MRLRAGAILLKGVIMTNSLSGRVIAAVRELNALYGYGDVRACKVYLSGAIEFTVQGYGMRPVIRRGRLIGNTVHALRHQRSIITRAKS